ncbi:MAG TPA: glycosyltransferase family 1 protein [Tepidisphaeraceae bacterium]|jgi:glycosyltransferase involved in cell wall biosynthesis|nr:glycosyltransferase family 1 protein [Tepidisphaeraceae bacterium]
MGKRLGINLVFLNPDRAGGAETYARSLLREYQQLDLDLDGRIKLFVGRRHGLNVDPERFELVECNINPRHQYRRIIWEQTHLPGILNRHRLDVVHFPYSAYPIRYRGKCVVSLHDTTRFVAPRGVPRAQIWYRRVMEERLRDRGHHVIAVSHADAAILQQHLGLPDQQMSVVYHGVSDQFRVERPFEGTRDYLLWVGRPYEHKRLDTLIEAYEMMTSNAPKLRLIGINDASRFSVGANVSVEKGVNHTDLAGIYQRALALVFPSSYESFGLPALEAMASGTAVICSDIPAFRELFSGAAEFTKVADAGTLAQGIEKIIKNPALRCEMELKGIELAREFTWRRCAEETMRILRRV